MSYAALVCLFKYLYQNGLTTAHLAEYLLDGEVQFKFAFHLLGLGLLIGWINWYSNEKAYKKYQP